MPFNRPHLLNTRHTFRYRFGYIRNGKRFLVTPWRNNLILDSGLDKIGTVVTAACWTYCLFGNQVAPNPVSRGSGAVTFTTVGTACTASGSFFSAADVGRLIKFDDAGGQERYITAFTSSTLVTLGVAPSPAIAGNTGTIWYVNQTALQSPAISTNTYGSNGGDNGTTAVVNVITTKRTFIGAAVGAPVTLTEIGFNDSAANANLFDRDIITGGVGLTTGDQPLAVAELITTYTPAVSTAVGNVGTGFDSSGNIIISGLAVGVGNGISYVDTAGNVPLNGPFLLEPAVNAGGIPIMATFSLPAFSNGAGPSFTYGAASGGGLSPYSNGNFYRDCSGIAGIAESNGTIYGFGWAFGSIGLLVQKFTSTFVKNSTQTLTIVLRKSWQRVLHN